MNEGVRVGRNVLRGLRHWSPTPLSPLEFIGLAIFLAETCV